MVSLSFLSRYAWLVTTSTGNASRAKPVRKKCEQVNLPVRHVLNNVDWAVKLQVTLKLGHLTVRRIDDFNKIQHYFASINIFASLQHSKYKLMQIVAPRVALNLPPIIKCARTMASVWSSIVFPCKPLTCKGTAVVLCISGHVILNALGSTVQIISTGFPIYRNKKQTQELSLKQKKCIF